MPLEAPPESSCHHLHMSPNVPPFQVDLIVAAAEGVGQSVFCSIGSILGIDTHHDGRHGHPPRERNIGPSRRFMIALVSIFSAVRIK